MSPTRRAYLRAGLGIGVATLAGCATRSGNGSTATDEARQAEPDAGPFEELSFEGGDLVVALTPDHGLSGVNLIASDGTIFEQASIATGVEAVRIPVLDPQPDDGGYRHYTPGVHELVGLDAEGDEAGTRTVPMEPEIGLIGVEQYRTGDRASDFGSLVVTVENTGTAPTWVYDIAYRGAPNFAANTELGENPGVFSVSAIPETESVLIPPDGQSSYIDATSPLLFSGKNFAGCSGEIEFAILIATANGDMLGARVAGTIEGETLPVGLLDEYVCSEVAVSVAEERSNSMSGSTTASAS
jgi:hypothetical protein